MIDRKPFVRFNKVSAYRREHGPWLVIVMAAIAMLIAQFIATFLAPEDMLSPNLGTAWAPYSDALGPWLYGGLTFLFDIPPPDYLYRPTIGVFWSAILATTGRVETIPIFFSLWLLAFIVGAYLLARDSALRNALVLWLCVSTIGFWETWHTVNIATTGVDLAAFVFTVSGVILLLGGPVDSRAGIWDLLAGSLCLGVAAAIRGAMMFGGPLMILVRVFLIARVPARQLLLSGLAFVGPIALDIVLQRHFGVVNNGAGGLFCVYFDPTHGWTPACHIEYLARKPSKSELLRGYFGFLSSRTGLHHLLLRLYWRVSRDLSVFQYPAVLTLIAALGLLGSITKLRSFAKHLADGPSSSTPYPHLTSWTKPPSQLLKAALVAGSLLLLHSFAAAHASSAVAWLALALAAAFSLRLWRSLFCFGGYIAGTAFLVLIGITFDRLQNTFAFTLYLGLGLLIMESRPQRILKSKDHISATPVLAGAALALVAFLYVGNYLAPSALRSTYQKEVQGRRAAIKVSDDRTMNRSLYFTGDGALVYTEHDSLPIGEVRVYRRFAMEGNANNTSFLQPNAFVE
jgi:hypothetical protein